MNHYKLVRRSGLAVSMCLTAQLSWSGIGVTPLGFGSQSVAMSSTDTAYSSEPTGINNNVAGIAAAEAEQFVFGLEPTFLIKNRHKDSLGNDKRVDSKRAMLLTTAWSSPLSDYPGVTLGLGFFAQGGAGFNYESLLTDFGNHDDLTALFGVFRVAPALAWQATDRLRLGVAASANYAQAGQKLLPNTSDAATEFFGVKINDLSGTSYSWRVGAQYDISENVVLGLSYGAKTELRLRKGSAVVNFESLGLGRVRYSDAEISGLSLPEEVNFGVAWQLGPRLSLGADINYFWWSEALGEVSTRFMKPDSAMAPATIHVTKQFGGQDNFSRSVGLRFKQNDLNVFYAGVNHTDSVIKKTGLNPLNNLQAKWHITGGWQRHFSPRMFGVVAISYVPEESKRYVNNELPLGRESEETFGLYSVLIELNYRWSRD